MAGTSEEAINGLIARFMDVPMCDNRDTAAGHLPSCNGSIDDAVGLYVAVVAATATAGISPSPALPSAPHPALRWGRSWLGENTDMIPSRLSRSSGGGAGGGTRGRTSR
uniref:Uncharacterized protein n=1 Tax=Leersia perrieri TaxID=77586 RepID=A0A0D9VGE1_9ORYZ